MRARDPHLSPVRVGSSAAPQTVRALHEVLDQLDADHAALTFIFFSAPHDPHLIAPALDSRLAGRGIAATGAGEVHGGALTRGAIVGMSLHGDDVRAAIEIIPRLSSLSLLPLVPLPEQLSQRIGRTRATLDPQRHLWLTLADHHLGDGPLWTPFLTSKMPRVELVGAALGNLGGWPNAIAYHGRVYRDAAAVTLLEYPRPFALLHHSHLSLTERWVTLTSLSSDQRQIITLNHRPAREVVAEALGLSASALTAEIAAIHPLGTRFRGKAAPASILDINPAGHLVMGCPLQPGERLNILACGDLIAETRDAITKAIDALGQPAQGLLLFNCLGRVYEAEHHGQLDALASALCQTSTCGLNSFGEQLNLLHLNHSLCGVALG